jgi:hypothetical protein
MPKIWLSGSSETSKLWALERIADQSILAKIVIEHGARWNEFAFAALERIHDQTVLAEIIRAPFNGVGRDSFKSRVAGRLESIPLATALAKEEFSNLGQENHNRETFLRLLEKVEDQAFLAEVGKLCAAREVCRIVIDRISDKKVLYDIIDHCAHSDICFLLARTTDDIAILKRILERLKVRPFPVLPGLDGLSTNISSFLRAEAEGRIQKLTERDTQ